MTTVYAARLERFEHNFGGKLIYGCGGIVKKTL